MCRRVHNMKHCQYNLQKVFTEIEITPDLETFLETSLKMANIPYTQEMLNQTFAYIKLMLRWNRAYNLTSVKEPEQVITRHIMDSLSLLPELIGENSLDVGSGAGLPGIPLAIFNPDHSFVLIDSNSKKYRFLNQVLFEIGIKNAIVCQMRIEYFTADHRFDNVLSRAFSSASELLKMAGPLCTKNGQLLLMKGVYPSTELSDIPENLASFEIKPLKVPFLEAERTLIRVKPKLTS